jgi:hypothetical protein
MRSGPTCGEPWWRPGVCGTGRRRHGLRPLAADYANNDLNVSNILTDGDQITGVVDWDEFGLGSRPRTGRADI